MLSPKTKTNIFRIIPFGVIWLVSSIVYTLLEKGLLGEFEYYPSTGNPYNFSQNIFVTPVSALITGLLIGIMEILFFNKVFSQKTLRTQEQSSWPHRSFRQVLRLYNLL